MPWFSKECEAAWFLVTKWNLLSTQGQKMSWQGFIYNQDVVEIMGRLNTTKSPQN